VEALVEREGLSVEVISPGRLAWRRFRKHRLAMISAGILLLLVVVCAFANVIAPYSKSERAGALSESPSWSHLMGTDEIGRDVLSRVIYGGRNSLVVGFAATLGATILGSLVGSLAGWFRGWFDDLLMRITDVFIAFPLLVFLIVLRKIPEQQAWAASLFGEPGTIRLTATILVVILWMPLARIVRGVVLSLREKEFIEAARSLGAPDRRIIFRHLLPNCIGAITVGTTLTVAGAILAESTLSFLGFGVQPTDATWGKMLADSNDQMTISPWLVWFPGLVLVLTVLCVNFVGDGLRDAFDPKQQKGKA
jgi:peptide/nickel transport system permease protein